ncbi:MAG TPA: hypothetical protein VFT82_03550 [Candidatus Paceibacterota bacterium]|nr:hypothetical protein [Candidatus Paceibacterota bacterium]
MNKNTLSIAAFVIAFLLIVGAVAYVLVPRAKYSEKSLDAFALCLASKKITMYGAAWCPHCQAEKARFGSSFKYIPYVECPENEKLCIDKGVRGYPTWITEDGTKYEGEQGIEGLAKISSCPLPQ